MTLHWSFSYSQTSYPSISGKAAPEEADAEDAGAEEAAPEEADAEEAGMEEPASLAGFSASPAVPQAARAKATARLRMQQRSFFVGISSDFINSGHGPQRVPGLNKATV